MPRGDIEEALFESKRTRLGRLLNAMTQRTLCSYFLTHAELMALGSDVYAYQKGRLWVIPVWITEITPEFVGVTPERGHGPLLPINVPMHDASSIATT